MAQMDQEQLMGRVLKGEAEAKDLVLSGVDRNSSIFRGKEGLHLDFKSAIKISDDAATAELARDILGFSNTEGGLILFGVTDASEIVGCAGLDSSEVHTRLGPYLGTRVDYEIGQVNASVRGRQMTLPFVFVRRSLTSYPNLIRKDVSTTGGIRQKVKYLRGSLFFRLGAETKVEPTGGDIDSRASELGFTGASPRTRSSFILEEDKPGIRLYAHINDRFYGRNLEVDELLAKYDSAKGRGVSIAGLGGIGKTELAIELVQRLFRSGRFRKIYSGSAKRTLLGPFGPQQTDPFFYDFPSFLRDLGGWLGIDQHGMAEVEALRTSCLSELRKLGRTLLFVDNLESIEDGRLFSFLENDSPENVWLLTTSRVHKIKNWIYAKQLDALITRDAAHLLRHELKRQGLEEFASHPIEKLEEYVGPLHQHPLSIRWFAWSCKRNVELWNQGPSGLPRDEIESFCVAQTIQNLPKPSQKMLAAIGATQGQIELTPQCLERVSGVPHDHMEVAFYDLESAGLVSSLVNDETGEIVYQIIPMAVESARNLGRQNNWESDFARRLREFSKFDESSVQADPLVQNLLEFDPRKMKNMSRDEISDLERRVNRAMGRPHGFKIELLALKAECERHLGNVISADDFYKEAADQILEAKKTGEDRFRKILLEAATVAKMRSHTQIQLRRAISYLMAIQQTNFSTLRILGTLVELFAITNEKDKYREYLSRVKNLRDKERTRFSMSQIDSLEEALSRAESIVRGHMQ